MNNLPGLFWGGRQAQLNSGYTHRTLVWWVKITPVFTRKDKVYSYLFFAEFSFDTATFFCRFNNCLM